MERSWHCNWTGRKNHLCKTWKYLCQSFSKQNPQTWQIVLQDTSLNAVEQSDDDDIQPASTQSSQAESQENIDVIETSPSIVNVKSIFPKKEDTISFKRVPGETWVEAKVLGRAGKATGKYQSWMNIKVGEAETCVNLDDLDEWKILEKSPDTSNVQEEVNIIIPTKRHQELSVINAKNKELNLLKEFQVYTEVPHQQQNAISTTWVITEKHVNNISHTKARLVARGFEEDQNFQADSPTVERSTLRIFVSISSIKNWSCKTIDVKSAFLQGQPINREDYLIPPPEERTGGVLWKLNKVIYGLNDAARNWYQSVLSELEKVNCQQSKFDPALFYLHKQGEVIGLFLIHVDDFIYAGTKEFEDDVINHIKTAFKIGTENEGNFKYIGLNIKQCEAVITVDQNPFAEQLKEVPITSKRLMKKFDNLNQIEQQSLRTAIGQINWMASQTRPDIAFDVLELSMSMKEPKVVHLLNANKLIKKLRTESYLMSYPRMKTTQQLKIVVYTDASFANLPDSVSSAGGHIIFLVGEGNQSCVLSWLSKKIKRVVKSTSEAEALALLEGLENALYLREILAEILSCKKDDIPIKAYVDSRNVNEAIHSTKLIVEKRLRIDIANIKQMLKEREIDEINWVSTDKQLADTLTKRGVHCLKLMNIIQEGIIEN